MKKKYIYVVVWITVVVVLSLMPKSSLDVGSVKLFKNSDKIVHFLMYSILMVLLILGFKENNKCKVQCLIFSSFFSISLGILLEYLQDYLEIGRSFDTFDIQLYSKVK